MRIVVKILVLLIFLMVIGCASGPTEEEVANADYGNYPKNEDQIIKNYMDRRLKDSDSAKYEFLNKPRAFYMGRGNNVSYGYAVCIEINSKNSYGGYTGWKPYFF